jgi:hypothetical protein
LSYEKTYALAATSGLRLFPLVAEGQSIVYCNENFKYETDTEKVLLDISEDFVLVI